MQASSAVLPTKLTEDQAEAIGVDVEVRASRSTTGTEPDPVLGGDRPFFSALQRQRPVSSALASSAQ